MAAFVFFFFLCVEYVVIGLSITEQLFLSGKIDQEIDNLSEFVFPPIDAIADLEGLD